MNLFTYVGGDPINYIDPLGLRLTPLPGSGYSGPGLPRPNNLPWDNGLQRAPGGSSSGCSQPKLIWICDDMCCDWDECSQTCRSGCPIIYSASSSPP